MKVLFVGDIVGRPGRQAVADRVPTLRRELVLDYVIANAENAAAGMGATGEICEALLKASVDVLTMGNHVYQKKEIEDYLPTTDRVIRPANFPAGAPGRGYTFARAEGRAPLAVLNLQGVVFMPALNCPFETADTCLSHLRQQTPCVVVDFHAEATAEKAALGLFLDGRCSAVLGTHTHVQTADERILPGGTAYISDVGMTGPLDSVIGMRPDLIARRFVLKMPQRFEVADGPASLCGVVLDIDEGSGRATAIQRLQIGPR